MSSLILMHVYYDTNGDIKAITPTVDSSFEGLFSTTTFPLSEVEVFLTGQRNPFDFVVREIIRAGQKVYKISKKQVQIDITRSLDSYLTKIDGRDIEPIILVSNNHRTNTFSVKLSPYFKELHTIGTDEEKDEVDNFIRSAPSAIYITKSNNPYHHLYTLNFLPIDLFNSECLYFGYDETLDFSGTSAYTKKLVKSYRYSTKGK